VYEPAGATFEYPVFSSLAECLGALELVVWDKNLLLKKEYLGEIALPIEEWFPATALAFDDPNNTVCTTLPYQDIHRLLTLSLLSLSFVN
jgi:phosphatidylserine decarboxylase